jgi:hypothetical protein
MPTSDTGQTLKGKQPPSVEDLLNKLPKSAEEIDPWKSERDPDTGEERWKNTQTGAKTEPGAKKPEHFKDAVIRNSMMGMIVVVVGAVFVKVWTGGP